MEKLNILAKQAKHYIVRPFDYCLPRSTRRKVKFDAANISTGKGFRQIELSRIFANINREGERENV